MQTDDDRASNPDLKPAIVFLSWMTVCYLAGFAVFEGTSQGLWFWYVSLNPPGWCPPTWLMTPISTVLYGLMGISVWQAAKEPSDVSKVNALTLFFIQLVIGAAWPWIFFAAHKMSFAVNVGYALFIVLIATTVLFWKIKPIAGKLLLPMIAWVAYFSIVELTLWRLNR